MSGLESGAQPDFAAVEAWGLEIQCTEVQSQSPVLTGVVMPEGVDADAVPAGARVLLVDDLVATGGTAEAACQLLAAAGGRVVECAFIVDLPDLGGRRRLEAQGLAVFTLCAFEGA